MRRQSSPRPEELLAAYADGGLDPAECAKVERYLADEPLAQRELEEIRSVLSQVRETAPEAAAEPNWAQMSTRIHAMCNELEDGRKLGHTLLDWLRRLFEPRYRVGLAAVAVIAVLAFVIVRNLDHERAPLAQEHGATVPQFPQPVDEKADRVPPVEDSLDEMDMDDIDTELDELEDEVEESIEYATGFGLDMFAEPDYESWVDALSEEALGELDEVLRQGDRG